MNCEFMIASTPLPPCMPLPKAMLRLPVSNTAKVMYARLLDEILTRGTEDSNRILFIRHGFRVGEMAFQHCPSGAEPVRPFLPVQGLYLVFQHFLLMLRPPQPCFGLFNLLIQFFQLFIHGQRPPWAAGYRCG